MSRGRILLIEDDASIRRGIVDALTFAGFGIREEGDGKLGCAAALQEEHDLLLLDLVLPGCDGLEILRAVRRVRPSLPVIILTARGSEDDRVRGLGLGSDDYVIKPFSIRELVARIEAVLRRLPPRAAWPKCLAFAMGTADLERREVRFRDGETAGLSERESHLLGHLARHADRVLSREEILETVWRLDPKGISTRTIDMHVTRLREKLRDNPARPEIIQTVRGRGYRLGPGVSTS
jgi:DNA-binding response OmpR family regulator